MLTRVRCTLVRTAVLAVLCFAFAISTASADPWSTDFALPTLNGDILSATTWNGKLVMGGRFTRAGVVAAARVVAWNGATHQPLGAGLPTDVTVLGSNAGVLYAFSSKTSAASQATLWSWNGTQWTSVVTFPTGSGIVAMTSHLGELHVAGPFTSIGGVSASQIARFDGSQWFAVGSGTTGTVNAIASFGGALYAGGTTVLGPGTGAIYKWDGSTWSQPGTGVGVTPSGTPFVFTLFADPSGLIVGGNYNRAGALFCTSPARWTGTTWECLTTPFASGLGSPLNRAGELVGLVQSTPGSAAGRWTGSAWEGLQDSLTAAGTLKLGLQGTDVYIMGGYIQGQNAYWKRWDGTAWSSPDRWEPEMRGLGGRVRDLIPYAGKMVAVGLFNYVGKDGQMERVGRSAAWDGSSWTPLGAGFLPWAEAATTFEGDLVVGGFLQSADNLPVNGVIRWNGSAWSAFGDGLRYPENFNQAIVYDVEVHGTELVACGQFSTSGVTPVPGIARWNGSAWLPLGTGFDVGSDDIPLALLSDGADLYAGGDFVAAGGVSAARIARWDGASWHAVGSGFANGVVYSLTRFANEVVAGGTFSIAGGSPANGAARLRNGVWVPMGTNALDVRDFDVHGGALHAAGKFLRDDLSTHIGLARWDGSTWVPLGGTATGGSAGSTAALAVASSGDEIFLGGSFDFVEGTPSVNIAAWQGSPLVSAPPGHEPRATFATPRPNPASSSVEFSFTLPEEGHVRLRIHDLQGREVAQLEDGWRGAGPQSLAWDGRLAGGGRAIGVYQAVLDYPGGRLTRRLVWLH